MVPCFVCYVTRQLALALPHSNSSRAFVPFKIVVVYLVVISSFEQVSKSHQTNMYLCSDKLTSPESVNAYHPVITARFYSYYVHTYIYTCYTICYCYFLLFYYFHHFITLQVPCRLESLWVEMIHTRTDFRIGKNRYGLK